MSSDAVGLGFAVAVAAREWWRWQAPRRAARAEARAECARLGHRWGEPFEGVGDLHRDCTRGCGAQQHYHRETDTWR